MESERIIFIHCEMSENYIELHMEDNGIGIEEETLRAIQDRIEGNFNPQQESDEQTSPVGIGLKNIADRLRIEYACTCLKISSEQLIGTDVCIHIPKK